MLFKKLILVLLTAMAIYSAKTNAASLMANKCSIGLLPLEGITFDLAKKDQIIKAYEAKGFFVSELKSQSEIPDVEYISDASIDCTSTYFGIMSQTSVRLIETSTNKIISQTTTQPVMEMFSCRIDLLTAINALPNCQIK